VCDAAGHAFLTPAMVLVSQGPIGSEVRLTMLRFDARDPELRTMLSFSPLRALPASNSAVLQVRQPPEVNYLPGLGPC